MALDTAFKLENSPGAIFNFSFLKMQRQTKTVIVNMLQNFFDAYNQEYKLQIPELVEVQNRVEDTKLFIERDFPYKERKFPMVIVSIKSAKERKMYIGADNYIDHKIIVSSSGTISAVPMYTGAGTISLSLLIATNSPDDRSRLSELIAFCFTHYYRWQYFYSLGDGNTFSIFPNTEELEFGSESEVKDDASALTYIYVTDISMKAHIEYTFTDVRTDSSVIGTVEVKGGPMTFGVDF